MSEEVMQIILSKGSKCRKVEVTEDGSIVNLFLIKKGEESTIEVVEKPTEGKGFDVNPLAINQKLFKKEREDSRQESTRKLIVEAFSEVKKNPEKYAKPFQTLMPKKTWSSKTVAELKELAESLGDCIADWVHQALEWAQRIANGESWETICNEVDTANWYRLVVWKNGYARLVGGSRVYDNYLPSSYVHNYDFNSSIRVDYTVPLVVLYKK